MSKDPFKKDLVDSEDEEGSNSNGGTVWTTEKVEDLKQSMKKGYEPKKHPFKDGDPNFRDANIAFQLTDWEREEMKKCAMDPIYYAKNYCYVQQDHGIAKIEHLRDYQHEWINTLKDNRKVIINASRQIGKTITMGIFISWWMIFNYDKNCMMLADKEGTTKELIRKVKVIIKNLPFFMKPGMETNQQLNMVFDNGCMIVGQTTTKKSGISFTIHLLYIDEFAHIDNNFIREFWTNVYPTLSSSDISKVVLTSSPNGFNLFWEIFSRAKKGKNTFVPMQVEWWRVPGRGEEFRQEEIANLGGSVELFNQQYGCQFIAGDDVLLSAEELRTVKDSKEEFEFREFEELDKLGVDYSGLRWKKSFDESECSSEYSFFFWGIDLASGEGGDYSVINIFKLVPLSEESLESLDVISSISDLFGLEQVAMFRSNVTEPKVLAAIAYTLATKIFYQDNLRIVVEYNEYGREFLNLIQNIYPDTNDLDDESLMKFYHSTTAKSKKKGLKLGKERKSFLAHSFKQNISKGRLTIHEAITIDETTLFSKNNKGTYSAPTGNDDAVMSALNANAVFGTQEFDQFCELCFDYLEEEDKNRLSAYYEDEDMGHDDDPFDDPEDNVGMSGSGLFGSGRDAGADLI